MWRRVSILAPLALLTPQILYMQLVSEWRGKGGPWLLRLPWKQPIFQSAAVLGVERPLLTEAYPAPSLRALPCPGSDLLEAGVWLTAPVQLSTLILGPHPESSDLTTEPPGPSGRKHPSVWRGRAELPLSSARGLSLQCAVARCQLVDIKVVLSHLPCPPPPRESPLPSSLAWGDGGP